MYTSPTYFSMASAGLDRLKHQIIESHSVLLVLFKSIYHRLYLLQAQERQAKPAGSRAWPQPQTALAAEDMLVVPLKKLPLWPMQRGAKLGISSSSWFKT